MAASPDIPEHGQSTQSLRRAVLFMVLLNAFTTALMLSAANIALPAIASEFETGAVALSWVPMAYLMASAMFVLIFGRLADMYGRRRIFLWGTATVIVTSIMAAASLNVAMLISARFLQGVSAAMLYATQMAIVTSVFPPRQRGRVIGLVVSVIYAGLAAGPLLGGVVVDALGWRYSFLLQVPMALLVLLAGLTKVRHEWSAATTSPFDFRGASAYALAILLLCLGVSSLPQAQGLLLLATSILVAWYFLYHARRIEHPILDIRVFFSSRVFTFSCTASLIMYSATYANVVLLSLYLQYSKQLSASGAGLLIMIQPVSMALLSPFIGRLSDRVEPRILASSGILLTAIGLIMLALLHGDSTYLNLVIALLLTGAGFSLFSSPNVNAIMGSVSQEYAGSASAAVATTRLLGQLSSMILVALAMTLFMGGTVISTDTLPLLERSITFSFGLAAAICLPGIAMSLMRGRLYKKHQGEA